MLLLIPQIWTEDQSSLEGWGAHLLGLSSRSGLSSSHEIESNQPQEIYSFLSLRGLSGALILHTNIDICNHNPAKRKEALIPSQICFLVKKISSILKTNYAFSRNRHLCACMNRLATPSGRPTQTAPYRGHPSGAYLSS